MQRFKSFLLEALEDGGEGTPYSQFSGGKAPKGKELTSRFSEYSPVDAVGEVEDMEDYMDKIEKRLSKIKDPEVVARLEAELDRTQELMDKKLTGLAATSLGVQVASAAGGPAGALGGRVAGTAMDMYSAFADLGSAWRDTKQATRGFGRGISDVLSGDTERAKENLVGALWDTGGAIGRGAIGTVGAALSVVPSGSAILQGTKTGVRTGLKALKLGKVSVKAGKAADVAAATAETTARAAREADDALNAARGMRYPDLETYTRTMDLRRAEAAASRAAADAAAEASAKAARVADRTKRAATSAPKISDATVDAVTRELSLGSKLKTGGKTLQVAGKGLIPAAKLAALGLLAGSGGVGSAIGNAVANQGGRGSLGGEGGGGGSGQLYVSSTAGLGGNVRPLTGG